VRKGLFESVSSQLEALNSGFLHQHTVKVIYMAQMAISMGKMGL